MPPKRKRPERGPPDSGPNRPSPHRPADTTLGQHDRGYDGGRGGRGGRNPRRNDRRESSQSYGGPNAPSSAPNNSMPSSSNRPPSSSSSAAVPPAPAPAPPTPAPAPQSAPPSPMVIGYDYSIITDDRVSKWTKGARQEVIDHGIQSRDDEDLTEVTTIFQELLQSATDGRLSASDAGKVVKEILGPEPPEAEREALVFDPHTLFLDTVQTFMDVELGTFRPQLRDFMMATEISPSLMRLVLDPPILQPLGLVRETFVRTGIRHSTNLLYRQSNYNLLREETEGYSKLLTELFTTSNTECPSSENVQAAFNKVMGLIGTFDLHPGRVLDVTLDIFASVLIKQFRFFIKFLRLSSWWPRNQLKQPPLAHLGGLPLWAAPDHFTWTNSEEENASLASKRLERDVAFWDRARKIGLDAFFELGGRQLATSEEQRLANGASKDDPELSIVWDWIKTTKTLPPPGNRDAAQMLGFKLRFYTSEARDELDVLPANLLYLIALLIKIGFISLTDLWDHVWPHDEQMEKVKETRMKELEEKERLNRPGGAANALMMAGALPDDTAPLSGPGRRDAPPSKSDADSKTPANPVEEKPKLPEPDDQKVVLLRCLLTIGALPESLFIIGTHPWILEGYPDILPLIHRVLHHSIQDVYQTGRPVASSSAEIPHKKIPDPDQAGVPKGSVRITGPFVKKTLRWPFPDKGETSEGSIYRFYWDEWSDNVPVCQNVDDVFTLCETFLNVIGVNIGQDAALISKLASIGAKSLAEDQSPENVARWLDLLKRLLVPSLSLLEPNSSVVDNVWNLVKQYPVHIRYNIYSEWYEGSISRLGPMKKAFDRTRLETLGTMKRLSLTNIPEMAKKLAKTAYASPGIVCKVALLQIEAYSNLIEAFVECAKYFTDLGYDVLVWSVLSSLGSQTRSRTQESSVLLTSKWLQALSRFSGKVFQRYSNMDASPILHYVDDQLSKGRSTDLIILKELISSMGGVVSDLDFTDAQLRAMTGGELLRKETLDNLGDKRSQSTKSANRLMKALVNSELAGRLLVNIAQYRQNAIFKVADMDAHIKYLATVVDDTHQIFLLYLDLLRSNLDPDTFNGLVPDVIRLMREFGLEPGLAFMIGRASLRVDMRASKALKDSQAQTAKLAADADGDVAMGSAGEEEVKAIADTKEDSAPSKVTNGRESDPLLDALQPLIDEIPNVLPNSTWRYLSPTCYVAFWSLQLGDFSFPQESYSAEVSRLRKAGDEVMRDRSDMSRPGMNKKAAKKSAIWARCEQLIQENTQEIERFSKTRSQVTKQLNTWFPAGASKVDATADAFLEECILPRLHLSPLDAEYCFRLIKYLHESSSTNFKLMSLYNCLFNHNRIRSIIFTCTVREAEHFGRFLRCVLSDLSRWHGDKAAYEKEALGTNNTQSGKKTYNGFATALDSDGRPTAFVEHDSFRDLLFRWHKELNSALRSCLDGMEWMHIRNAITVLKTVIDFFPAITFMAEKFLDQLKTITERESASKNASESEQGHRVDLSVTAQTAYSELQKRRSKWMIIQAFRPGTTAVSKEEQKGSTLPTKSSLRASASEFKPSGSSGRNQSAAEVEDGEVKDNKNSKTATGPSNEKGKEQPSRPLPVRESSKDAKSNTSAAGSGRPVTPRPAAATTGSGSGGRSESNRSSTLPPGGHGLPSRPELPSRPDMPLPGKITTDRFGRVQQHNRRGEPAPPPRDSREYPNSREPRDARDAHPRDNREAHPPREGRDFRTPEAARAERPRDLPSSDRRAPEPAVPRDAARQSDRDWPNRAEPPPRWEHPSGPEREGRSSRDRPPHGSNRHDGRLPRDHAAATPAPAPASQTDAVEPPINPERARLLAEPDRLDMINPARIALITETRDHQPRGSPRDSGRDRAPRNESPRPTDPTASGSQADSSREDRHGRHRHSDYHGSSRDGHADAAPSHPRGDRNADRDNDRGSGPRDSSFNNQSSRAADHEHGRLNSQQDPNYGRLNSIQSVADMPAGAPSGPRGRGRNSARLGPMNGPPMRNDNRFPVVEPIRPPSPERHPPTGPSSSRNRRGAPYDNSGGNVNSPTSTGPAPASGVHPDRVRQINNQQPAAVATPSPPPPPPPPPPPTAPSGIHPDRLNQISAGGPGSGPQQSGHGSSRPPMGTPDRPSMSTPNSSRQGHPPGGPSSQMNNNNNNDYPASTPTGPSAASNDRMRPGGSRQLRGIQNTLEKASADSARGPGGAGLRVSRSRANLAGSDAQILTGSSPVNTPIHERGDPMGIRGESSGRRGDRDSGRDRDRDREPRESGRDRDRDDTGRSQQQPPPPPPPPSRPEPIQVVGDSRDHSGRDSRGLANGDEYGGGGSRGDHERGSSSRRDHHRSDRSGRAPRRSSPAVDRGSDRGAGEREKESRDYRDRSSRGAPQSSSGGAPGGDRDLMGGQGSSSSSRRSMRDSGGPRELLPGGGSGGSGGRDMGHHRGSGGGIYRSDGPLPPPPPPPPSHGSGHHHGGHGGHGGRGGDDGMRGGRGGGGSQRDSRSSRMGGSGGGGDDRGGDHSSSRGDDRGRKRRSEGPGGDGSGGSHQDKRPRR